MSKKISIGAIKTPASAASKPSTALNALGGVRG